MDGRVHLVNVGKTELKKTNKQTENKEQRKTQHGMLRSK